MKAGIKINRFFAPLINVLFLGKIKAKFRKKAEMRTAEGKPNFAQIINAALSKWYLIPVCTIICVKFQKATLESTKLKALFTPLFGFLANTKIARKRFTAKVMTINILARKLIDSSINLEFNYSTTHSFPILSIASL